MMNPVGLRLHSQNPGVDAQIVAGFRHVIDPFRHASLLRRDLIRMKKGWAYYRLQVRIGEHTFHMGLRARRTDGKKNRPGVIKYTLFQPMGVDRKPDDLFLTLHQVSVERAVNSIKTDIELTEKRSAYASYQDSQIAKEIFDAAQTMVTATIASPTAVARSNDGWAPWLDAKKAAPKPVSLSSLAIDPAKRTIARRPGPPGDDLLALGTWGSRLVALTSYRSGKEPVALSVRMPVGGTYQWVRVPSPKGMGDFPHRAAAMTLHDGRASVWGGVNAEGRPSTRRFTFSLAPLSAAAPDLGDARALWREVGSGHAALRPIVVERATGFVVFGGGAMAADGKITSERKVRGRAWLEYQWIPTEKSDLVPPDLAGASVLMNSDHIVFGPGVTRTGKMRVTLIDSSFSRKGSTDLRTANSSLPEGFGMGQLVDDGDGRLLYFGGQGPDGAPSDAVFLCESAADSKPFVQVGHLPEMAGPARLAKLADNVWASVLVTPRGSATYLIGPAHA
jgi:hypothetical protein